MTTNKEKIKKALDAAFRYSSFDGAHHKQWCIDQIVQALTGSQPKYEQWIKDYEQGDEGPQSYVWDRGTPP